jgi:SOS-response transcriptional repressor LexA
VTPRQRTVLNFVAEYQRANDGVTPSMAEIAVGIGLSAKSKGAIHQTIVELERQGRIERGWQRARSITLGGWSLAGFTADELLAELARRQPAQQRVEQFSDGSSLNHGEVL